MRIPLAVAGVKEMRSVIYQVKDNVACLNKLS